MRLLMSWFVISNLAAFNTQADTLLKSHLLECDFTPLVENYTFGLTGAISNLNLVIDGDKIDLDYANGGWHATFGRSSESITFYPGAYINIRTHDQYGDGFGVQRINKQDVNAPPVFIFKLTPTKLSEFWKSTDENEVPIYRKWESGDQVEMKVEMTDDYRGYLDFFGRGAPPAGVFNGQTVDCKSP